MKMAALGSYLTAVCMVAFVVGCGGGGTGYDGPPRAAVGGKVTLGGAPLDSGAISFVPKDAANRTVSAPIAGGSYTLPEGKGPNFGTHDVVISASPVGTEIPEGEELTEEQEAALAEEEGSGDEDEEDSGDDEGPFSKYVLSDNILPEKYNTHTELSAEVTSSSHTFDFELSN